MQFCFICLSLKNRCEHVNSYYPVFFFRDLCVLPACRNEQWILCLQLHKSFQVKTWITNPRQLPFNCVFYRHPASKRYLYLGPYRNQQQLFVESSERSGISRCLVWFILQSKNEDAHLYWLGLWGAPNWAFCVFISSFSEFWCNSILASHKKKKLTAWLYIQGIQKLYSTFSFTDMDCVHSTMTWGAAMSAAADRITVKEVKASRQSRSSTWEILT